MKLHEFHAQQFVSPPLVPNSATKDFMVGVDDVHEIELNSAGTVVRVCRTRLPDLIFTNMGHGVFQGDCVAVPGNKHDAKQEAPPPVVQEKGKRR